ncbi:MAG: hypothetical protein IKR74_04700 [Bacilli bacterium]|nr:hypothetical protein [Bacilli bacterium]
MRKEQRNTIAESVDTQIEAIRAGFEDKENQLRSSIMALYLEVQNTSEEDFVKKNVEEEIDWFLKQIETHYSFVNPSPEFFDSMSREQKRDYARKKLYYLEIIAGEAMRVASLRKGDEKFVNDHKDTYRQFKAMSPEDLQEYILRCVEKQLDASNEEIARLESLKDTFSPSSR